MTSDVELLPLPDWGGAQIIPDNLIKDYARACVSSATEALRAITELRERHHDNLHDAIYIAEEALRDSEAASA